MARGSGGKKWIQAMHMKKGAYGSHSKKQMMKDAKKGGKTGKRANLAMTLAKLRKHKS